MIGTMDKLQAHKKGGRLHRAVSIFIFNSKGDLLLQQRAVGKYHSGGKWSNTCCSHPFPGEKTIDAAYRCLKHEMGMADKLDFVFSFIYREELEDGLVEHEFDHVYFGISDNLPVLNPDEAADYKYISMDELAAELANDPEKYSKWLIVCYERVLVYYRQLKFV